MNNALQIEMYMMNNRKSVGFAYFLWFFGLHRMYINGFWAGIFHIVMLLLMIGIIFHVMDFFTMQRIINNRDNWIRAKLLKVAA